MTRTLFTIGLIITSISSLFANPDTLSDSYYMEKANEIHKKYITIDSHNDSALWYNHPDKDYSVTKGQVTFDLMQKGGLDAAFFAIYLDQKALDQKSLDSAFNYAVEEIKLFKEYVNKRGNKAEFAYCPNDLIEIKKKGKSSVILAIENGYAVGNKLKNVDYPLPSLHSRV